MTENADIRQDPQSASSAPAAETAPTTDAISATAAAPAADPAAAAAATRLARTRAALAGMVPEKPLTFLTPALGFAAGIGLLVGTMGALGVGHLFASPTPAPATKSADAGQIHALQGQVAQIEGQLKQLKTSLDAANRQANSQLSRIASRLERTDRAQTEANAKVGKVTETLDRLDRRLAIAAHDSTGSALQRTALAEPKQPATPPAAEGWFVRQVMRGRALVEYRHTLYEAAPGLDLPQLGRVRSIKRQDGRWVVVAEKGLITAQAPASYGRRAYRYDD